MRTFQPRAAGEQAAICDSVQLREHSETTRPRLTWNAEMERDCLPTGERGNTPVQWRLMRCHVSTWEIHQKIVLADQLA